MTVFVRISAIRLDLVFRTLFFLFLCRKATLPSTSPHWLDKSKWSQSWLTMELTSMLSPRLDFF